MSAVIIDGEPLSRGIDYNIKGAEQNAAEKARTLVKALKNNFAYFYPLAFLSFPFT